ncbi:peptidoglycan editing factor PgeF [Patescibacteria group bacterium]|nr:peptidoglycan editing factor PgeF [Patescibacteria group bacterium]
MIKFFKKYPEIIAGMSEKKDGSMRLFWDGILKKKYLNNCRKYLQKIGANYTKIFNAQLAHGIKIAVIDPVKSAKGCPASQEFNRVKKIIPRTDALITREKKTYLSITIADCLPVFFYDSGAGIIALSHAGWRGIIKSIISKTIKKIISLGGNPQNIAVAIGPGISQCHFEIKKDVLAQFKKYNKFIEKRNDKYFLDLRGVVQKQLRENGIQARNIENNNKCTFCRKAKYFSYRRDGAKSTGLMMAVIGRK